MSRGTDWTVSMVNFGGGTASGRLLIEYPGQPVLVVLQPPVLQPVTPAPESPPAEPEKTISEDGVVETRYPDGRIRRQRVGECGFVIIFPNGSQSIGQCVEVQGEEIPDLPAELLAREDVNLTLEAVAENLLEYIRQAVGDESAVANYMKLEEGKNLQERIFLRFEALSLLIP